MKRSKTKRSLLGLSFPVKLILLVAVAALWWNSSPGRSGEAEAATPRAMAVAQEAPPPVSGAQATAPEGGADAVDQEVPDLAGAQEAESPADAEEHHGPTPADFFLVIIAILVFAKVFGEAAERVGQPAVLGELVAGLVLGGSVLGIVPTDGELGAIIHLLAEVGVAVLLFEIGLETDLKEMFRVGAASSSVALVGVALPFALGFAYWFFVDPTSARTRPGSPMASSPSS